MCKTEKGGKRLVFNFNLWYYDTSVKGNVNKIAMAFMVVFLVYASSCSTLKIGIQLLTRAYDGNALIRNKGQVRDNLQMILLSPDKFSITGYTRRAFAPDIERTPSRYHCFYVINSNDDVDGGAFFTLSFNGTKKRTRSEGAWAIDTETDKKSYISYIYGPNEWDVREIPTHKGINTEMTITKILYRIDHNINYYYNDHKYRKDGVENCITALQNTMVENR